MTPPRIAIVGAGIAGLTCARALAAAGLAPVIFDKSRGVGGRMATRRADGGLQFDHGAPSFTAKDPAFAALVQEAEEAGAVARWHIPPHGGAAPAHVGLPGMSGFARHLARGLDIRGGTTVTAVAEDGAGCRITTAEGAEVFDHVILTLPAPQILRLLGPQHPLAADLSAVSMAPCLTLMAAFPPRGHAAPDPEPAADLQTVTLEASKPGRDATIEAWVAHATEDFSQRHLELDLPQVAALMLPLLCAHVGRQPSEAVHSVAHRWRYGVVDRALGRPYLADPSHRLHLGGDWCLGPTVQDAWASGRAIAGNLLARLAHRSGGR